MAPVSAIMPCLKFTKVFGNYVTTEQTIQSISGTPMRTHASVETGAACKYSGLLPTVRQFFIDRTKKLEHIDQLLCTSKGHS